MSSLPLGLNRIKIERSLTTSALAVFVPFVTQELFMGGNAMYYGLNALSNNMILLDRKQSRCPNGLVFGTPFRSRIIAVIIAFIINYAAYFSEIYRGGIESIPVGQYEAGQVLGLTKTQTFFKVVLFQVVKRIMAPMSNEVITLVKDTSLANVIAVGELIMSAQNIVKVYAIIWPLFYTAIFYLIFCGVLTLLFNALEKKLNYYRG